MRPDVIAKSVNHDCSIHAVQAAAANHVFLAGMPLLRWGSLQEDTARQGDVDKRSGRRKESRHARRGDDVVTARVTNLRQRVILRQDGHSGVTLRVKALALPRSFEGGLHAIDPAARRETVFFDDVRQHRHGTMLFEGGLRVGMQVRHDVRGGFPQPLRQCRRGVPRLLLAGVILLCMSGRGGGRHALGDVPLHRLQICRRGSVGLSHTSTQS